MATKKKKEIKEEPKKEEITEELTEKNSISSLIELIAIIIAVIVIIVFFPKTVIWNIVVLLLILSILIFVHELGHFIMAKKFGVHVYEFAIGMGPLVYSFRRKNDPTLYSIRALPIGGYNAIAGESYEDDDKISKDKMMCNKPKWQRMLILVAGVTMNFITAFILLFIIALTSGATEQSTIIAEIEPNTPAQSSGLVVGDKIIELNGHKVDSWFYLSVVSILKTDSNTFKYVVEHQDGKVETFEIQPLNVVQDQDGHSYEITDDNTVKKIVEEHNLKKGEYQETKIIGIKGSNEVKHGVKNALKYMHSRFWNITRSMYLILGSLFTGRISLDSLSGPVGMYTIVQSAAKVGIINIIYLTAYLSINLGVMNILPFPAFDGGHILFILIELITRHKVNEKIENTCHLIGFIILFALMILITFKDIINLIK